jgi:hypothetical protein
MHLQALSNEIIRKNTKSVRLAYDLIAIILIDGEILLGGLSKHWKWNDRSVEISFNTEDGKQYGDSHAIEVSIEKISGIVTIPLSEASIPKPTNDSTPAAWLEQLGIDAKLLGIDKNLLARLPVQDYPNPLAKVICHHNLAVAERKNLRVGGYVERALSTTGVPASGIWFDHDFVAYADWEYFSRQVRGGITFGVNIGFAVVEKDSTPSMEGLARNALKTSVIYKFQTLLTSTVSQDGLVIGKIFYPESATTTLIEGEECIVIHCKSGSDLYPILIKPSGLKYPVELINFIGSDLRFYGEFLPIPLELYGKTYYHTMLARAIGYVQV